MGEPTPARGGSSRISKRLFDLFFSVLGLLVLAPVGIVVAILIKLSDGGPVL